MNEGSNQSPPYWLTTWLASKGIKNGREAAAALGKRSIMREAREVATQWSGVPIEISPAHNLVAGTGLRLDDLMTCPNPQCRRQQVDVLFRHAWHYFDKVLLPDGVGELLRNPPPEWDQATLIKTLADFIDIAVHIESIGASSLVHYHRPIKPSETVLEENGIQRQRWNSAWDRVESALAEPSRFTIEHLGDRQYRVDYLDPILDQTREFEMELEDGIRDPALAVREGIAHSLLHHHMYALEQDLATSKALNGSLGSTLWSHAEVLPELSGEADASKVLFELTFPSLSHIPIGELLSLREHEKDAFTACRSALQTAAKEMIAEKSSTDPKSIADAIRLDIVEPELARLKMKLEAAQRAMRRKTTFSIAVTGVSTVCGMVLGGAPGAIGGAAAGMLSSGALSTASRFCDAKADIESSDMFFLWKALGHAE